MSFIVGIIIIIRIDDSHIVNKADSLFNCHAGTDMHAQEFIFLHIGLDAGRYHHHTARQQRYVFRNTDVISGRGFRLANRHGKNNIFIFIDFFKTTDSHFTSSPFHFRFPGTSTGHKKAIIIIIPYPSQFIEKYSQFRNSTFKNTIIHI